MAPIRAKKLRYFKDRNFRARLAPPPAIGDGDYPDCPQERPDDWSGYVRATDSRLGKADDESGAVDDGGLQQQRHRGLGDDAAKRTEPPKQTAHLGHDKEDANHVTDKQ